MKNHERKEKMAPIKNVNRAFLIGLILFFNTGILSAYIISNSPFVNSNIAETIVEIITYATLTLPMILFAKSNFRGSKDIISIKINKQAIKDGLICAALAYPLMLMALFFASKYNMRSEITSEEIASVLTQSSVIENIVRAVLIPAVVEEFVFRGCIFGVYSKKNTIVGIFLSSILFSLMHCNLYQIPYTVVGGIVFACSAYITDNIGTSIIGHFTVNLISLGMHYMSESINKYCPEKLIEIEGIITGLIIAIGVAIATYLLIKLLRKQIKIKPLIAKDKDMRFSDFITLSLLFTLAILILTTSITEGVSTLV